MITFVVLVLGATAATLAELLAQDPQLSLASSLTPNFPAWSNPSSQGTLIVARDSSIRSNANLPTGSYGVFYYNQTIVWSNVHYLVLEGTEKNMKLVYDNYAPGDGESKFEVHIRGYGLVDLTLDEWRRADNGMLYIAPDPVIPVVLPTVNLPLIGCTRFAELVASLGMGAFIDKLDGITIFAPTDDAIIAFESTLNSYSKVQKEAFVLHHILPRVIYTTNIVPQINSLLNQRVTLRFGDGRIDVSGNASITIADNMMLNGVAQLMDRVLVPINLPTEQQRVNMNGNEWPATSTGSNNPTTGSNPSTDSNSNAETLSFVALSVFLASLCVL
jgi:hypothetical protein